MARGTAPLLEDDTGRAGFPARGLVAGRSIWVDFFVPIEPQAKGRPRAQLRKRAGGQPYIHWHTPQETIDYEDELGVRALKELRSIVIEGEDDFTMPIEDRRILARIDFWVTKPKSYPRSVQHMTKRPDLDNLVKAVFDALQKHRVIQEDSHVTQLWTSKRYADAEHPAGMRIQLTCLPV